LNFISQGRATATLFKSKTLVLRFWVSQ